MLIMGCLICFKGVAFSWSLNTSRDGGLIVDVPRDSYSERGMRSKVSSIIWVYEISLNMATLFYFPQLRYTVNTPMDYGSVSCSVAEEMTEDDGIGAGRPCVYHIVPAGKMISVLCSVHCKLGKFHACFCHRHG